MSGRQGGTDRVLAVLKELARHPDGTTLGDLARSLQTPKSSVHRLLVALQRADLALRPRPGHYVLGSEFVRLAYAHVEARQESQLVGPCLRELSEAYAETAHYAELEGAAVVYRAKVVPRGHAVQMTSTIGGRTAAYRTGVGKALLASRLAATDDVAGFLERYGPLDARTPNTITDPQRLLAELREAHERGYALDDEENDLGINCIAFPLFLESTTLASGSISVAALKQRVPLERLRDDAEAIRAVIDRHLGSVTRG